YTTLRPEDIYRPDIDDLDIRGMLPPALLPFEELPHAKIFPIKVRSPSVPEPDADTNPNGPSPMPRPGGGGGGGGGGLDREVSVTYDEHGEQTELQIKQYNLLSDNDVVLQGQGPLPVIDGNVAQLAVQADTVLNEMAANASSVVPVEWWMDKSGE